MQGFFEQRRRGRALRQASQQALWEQYEREPNFFGDVTIARDGGFSEVGQLFSWSRFFWASVSIAFLVMNIYSLLRANGAILLGSKWVVDRSENRDYLVSNVILRAMFPRNGKEFRPEVLVALFELGLLAVTLGFAAYVVWTALDASPGSASRWRAVSQLFWESLNRLASLSSMKMLYYVTPAVLVSDFCACRTRAQGFAIVSSRLLYTLIGLDAFLLKLQMIDSILKGPEGDGTKLISVLVFLNQLLGIVQVNVFVQKRILDFIFAGEDGVLNEKESAAMQLWHAMLTQRFYHAYKLPTFIAMMLTYTDYDFQALALNSEAKHHAGHHPGGADVQLTGQYAGQHQHPDVYAGQPPGMYAGQHPIIYPGQHPGGYA